MRACSPALPAQSSGEVWPIFGVSGCPSRLPSGTGALGLLSGSTGAECDRTACKWVGLVVVVPMSFWFPSQHSGRSTSLGGCHQKPRLHVRAATLKGLIRVGQPASCAPTSPFSCLQVRRTSDNAQRSLHLMAVYDLNLIDILPETSNGTAGQPASHRPKLPQPPTHLPPTRCAPT